jgi:hypothetical protein
VCVFSQRFTRTKGIAIFIGFATPAVTDKTNRIRGSVLPQIWRYISDVHSFSTTAPRQYFIKFQNIGKTASLREMSSVWLVTQLPLIHGKSFFRSH